MRDLSKVIKDLDTLLGVSEDINPESAEQISKDMNAQGVAHLLRDLKVANDLADEVKKKIGKAYDYIRMVTMPEKMDGEGIESPFNVQSVGSVRLTDDVRVSMGNKAEGYAWLDENGHSDLITETVSASSLAALIRRKLRDGEEVPDDIFKITPITRASITGLKK